MSISSFLHETVSNTLIIIKYLNEFKTNIFITSNLIKVIQQTKGYDYRLWPEIGFVEAYLKGTTETSKPVSSNVYNNPSDYSKYVSANAIEFPFKTTPYQDLGAIPFFYELFERTYLSSFYTKFINDEISKKQIDKFYGNIESKNIENSVGNSIELNQILKNYKFDYNSFIAYLKKISNDGNGESWQTYIRSKYKTEYIDNLLKTTNDIYSIDTISNRSIKISSDLELANNLKEYLESTDSSKINFLDTYPFTDINWISGNTSNGNTVSSLEQFNDTTKTFVYLDDKKTIARVNETEKYETLSLLSDFRILETANQPYVSTTNAAINNPTILKSFYNDRKIKDFYPTESYINYGNSYSGNVGTQIQTTSLLNTPYFVNALIKGVEDNKINFDFLPISRNNFTDSMSDSDGRQEQNESELTERCWKGYTQQGMKTMFGKRYPNCVKKKKKY
jgi:hypothetical protein